MIPQTQPRKPRNSSRVNLIISACFHGLIVVALIYFAAREGLLGKKLKVIAVEMVKKEKPPEKPKEPDKPKEPEPPKIEQPKIVNVPKIDVAKTVQAPPVSVPAVAPPPVAIPSFTIAGKEVESVNDPVQLYKGMIEYALRSRWDRPVDAADRDYVAEVEVTVDRSGQISNFIWKKKSGDKRWDDSVGQALAATKGVNRPPPPNFPSQVLVRFDVQELTETLVQSP